MTTTTEEPIVRGAGYRLSTSAGGTHDPVLIDLDAIRTDGGTQARAGLHEETVAEYAATWQDLSYQQNGLSKMPPIVLFHDGESYWLADGFHRVAAYWRFLTAMPLTAAPHAIAADVKSGTRRDAVLYACGANASHGLRRTNADKRRAVERVLGDEEWRQWSDREIARRCNVSDMLVATIRRDLYPQELEDTRTVARNGTTYQQKPPTPKPNISEVEPPARTLDTSPLAAAQARFAALGWSLQRRDNHYVLSRLDGSHYATTPDLAPHLATLATFEAGAVKRAAEDAPADATPHLPPDFTAAQRRAEKLALTLSMNPHGIFTLLNDAGMGTTIYTWPDVLSQITEHEARAIVAQHGQQLDRIAALVAAERSTSAVPFWQALSPAHPTAHLWTQIGPSVWKAACGAGSAKAPGGSVTGGYCSSCVRAAERQTAPAQQHEFVIDPLAAIRTSLAGVAGVLAQLAGELEALVADPAVDTDDYDRLSHAIGAARRALEETA